MRPSLKWLLVVALCSLSVAAFAQERVEAAAPSAHTHPSGEIFGARIRYGVVMRQGSQDDVGPGLSYDGLTPNDVQLQLNYFPIDLIGVELNAQREGFALFGAQNAKVTAGSLIRAHAGPKVRVKFGPLRIEALVGFQYAQLPEFGSSVSPTFHAGARQGVLLASRAVLDLPAGFNVQARGEYPVSVGAADSAGNKGKSTGFAAGGGIGYTIGNADKLTYGVLVDYQYVTDRLEVSPAGAGGGVSTVSQQTLSRVGAGLELNWLDAPPAPPPPKFGGLVVAVLDADSGQPLPNATVSLQEEDEAPKSLTTAADGTASATQLVPGMITAKVNAGGYLPAEGSGQIVAGQNGRVEVRAKKEPPKTGGLLVTITDVDGNAPLEGAVVTIGDKELLTAADGTVHVPDLKPGPIGIKVTQKGYKTAEEAATVTAGRESPVPIGLVAAQKRVLASITGLVRNTRGGAPISADLEVPELKLKTKADEKGAFTMRVPGGTYRVIISAQGYLTQEKNLTVKDGDQAIFNVDMFPGRGK